MKKFNKILSGILAVIMLVGCFSVSAFAATLKIGAYNCTLGVGETCILKTNQKSVFSSNKPSVVSVNKSTGKMSARKSGTAVVTVKVGNQKKSCTVKVYPAPKSINLNATSTLYVGIGETFDFNSSLNSGAASYHRIYSSSNSSVMSIKSSGGLATAKTRGDAVITVKCFNGVKKEVKVRVCYKPTSITFEESNITLEKGQSFKLVSHVNALAAAYKRSYKSNNTKIATMSGSTVKAVAVGKTTVTVTTYNGIKKSATITVTPKNENLTRAQKDLVLKMYQKNVDKRLGVGKCKVIEDTEMAQPGFKGYSTISRVMKDSYSFVAEFERGTFTANYNSLSSDILNYDYYITQEHSKLSEVDKLYIWFDDEGNKDTEDGHYWGTTVNIYSI